MRQQLLPLLIPVLACPDIAVALFGRRHADTHEVGARDLLHAKMHRRSPKNDLVVAQKDCPSPSEIHTYITLTTTVTLPYPSGGAAVTNAPSIIIPNNPTNAYGSGPAATGGASSGTSSGGSGPSYGGSGNQGGSSNGSSSGSDNGSSSGSSSGSDTGSSGGSSSGSNTGSSGGSDNGGSSSGPSSGAGGNYGGGQSPQPSETAPSEPVGTASAPVSIPTEPTGYAGQFWLEGVKHQGITPFNTNSSSSSYPVFRNVKSFGAKGDGVTDDTDAINQAISAPGTRCGRGCDSTTTEPALVYFPAGTYLVSKPIVALYLTQLIGDPTKMPILKAASSFDGMAVIDSDPYLPDGSNFYTNQNNFFRAVRNFVIDLTATKAGTGIHWQVAQASSLINIRFEMGKTDSQGIFMDNGSGGFMSDLTFNGGKLGMFLGNQQFTTRALKFNGCQKAILMNWNWAWTFKSVSISNCGVGIDMTSGNDTNQSVGSILVQDSIFENTPVGVKTLKDATSGPKTGGTLILDNLKTNNVPLIVASNSSEPILSGSAGATNVESWGQGRRYSNDDITGQDFQTVIRDVPQKPSNLLDSKGNIFEKSRPQYENLPASSFLSARDAGAKGDGKTDDTAALQQLINSCAANGKVVFIDHGHYLVSKTLNIPAGTRITGEIWPVIMSTGKFFADANNPQPVIKVGKAGQQGVVEMSDLIFSTQGPAAGAIVIEWNMADPKGKPGSNGLWDVHVRIGGAAGTKLQSDTCTKDPFGNGEPNPNCVSAFMLMHVGKTASLLMENNWFWTSDHELDLPDHNQISIYSGRGIWIESQQGPVWMYATASEHNVFYQYQLTDASNVYMTMIQTETPYYQAKPAAPSPFAINKAFNDPTFSDCPTYGAGQNNTCAKAWGLRVQNSKNVLVYGAGLYSFFENYDQTCTSTESCQQNMVSLEGDLPNFFMYNLNTKGTTNMITIDGKPSAAEKDNKNGFCETIALFSTTTG